ncbi:hypothetical protein [Pseudomonas aeruginosa]|uniref:hypothetical protein n=1 Tax=Pseudomonas aeruginosa TaxID=287 RepID=UPI000EB192D7|nr:hypothetical protein [Pseudomonas aeruginosa]EIU1413928.1 hypothetical protein [Pseudomonas aeruginosa]MCG9956519.1 hypothetical protein [Pseudomonas aeruginosa]MCS7968630.1 hypothetical protein [Pseudomonas aeruginosa]MCS8135137.1 hypothetical protein [Pseudomonas aeruginosa]MCS8177489.1 hypothetical protein [Pseudomonas aeruginosa]
MTDPGYKQAGYFDSYNQVLGKHCNWEVELFTSLHDGQDSLRVFRLASEDGVDVVDGTYGAGTDGGGVDDRRVFMGCIPPETPVGALICCGSLCLHYYNLGVSRGAALLDTCAW